MFWVVRLLKPKIQSPSWENQRRRKKETHGKQQVRRFWVTPFFSGSNACLGIPDNLFLTPCHGWRLSGWASSAMLPKAQKGLCILVGKRFAGLWKVETKQTKRNDKTRGWYHRLSVSFGFGSSQDYWEPLRCGILSTAFNINISPLHPPILCISQLDHLVAPTMLYSFLFWIVISKAVLPSLISILFLALGTRSWLPLPVLDGFVSFSSCLSASY